MTAPVLSVRELQIRLHPQGASTHAIIPPLSASDVELATIMENHQIPGA
jgi:hypothetical protein